jgi:phenylacetate-CoA ligase
MISRLLYDVYRLRRHLHLSKAELDRLQLKQLKATLKHAYYDVPFYHRKLKEANVRPDDIEKTDDLRKIPVTTKSELQSAALSDLVASGFSLGMLVERMTSGSTGMPLTLMADGKTVDYEMALWSRAFMANGVRPWHKISVVTDPKNFPSSGKLTQRLGLSRRDHVSIFDSPEIQQKLIEKFNPDVIRGYSSSLALLADHCQKETCKIRPRFVFTAAELLDKVSRNTISNAFHAELFDNYACIEFGLLSWECLEHAGYHINVDSVMMEVLEEEEAVSPGERGDIVCTGLVNRAMPLIRYKMGDVGVISEEQCPCGRALPIMKVLEGREGDFLITTEGRTVSPIVFFPYPFENLEKIKQFRVIQEKRDLIVIQLVLKEPFEHYSSLCEKATAEIRRVFGEDMRVEFQVLEGLRTDASTKLRKIMSNIPR